MEIDNELLLNLQAAQQKIQEIEEKIQVVEQNISELNQFEISLDGLENNKRKEMLASVGKGVYIKTEVKDEKLFVDVGSGILLKKGIGEAKNIVKNQKDKLNEMRLQLRSETENVNENTKKLVEEAEKTVKGK